MTTMSSSGPPLSMKRAIFIFLIALQLVIVLILQVPFSHLTGYHHKFHKQPKHSVQHKRLDAKISRAVQEAISKINQNPIYVKFNISNQPFILDINLLIIVSSAPKRSDRRSAIRETWWKQCKSNNKMTIKCLFMTDTPDTSTEVGRNVMAEEQIHKDLAFQNLKGGVEFGRRFLYHMLWAMKNYNFDYFMRMDDDYFFCLERFLHEFPMPKRKMYHWGFVHCVGGIVRPEESIIVLSRDLIQTFLDQDPNKIKGHPWADQMIATWVGELNLTNLYNHDPRLHHTPPLMHLGNYDEKFKQVCKNYIGVHGSYPKDMRHLWTLREGNEIVDGNLDTYAVKCSVPQSFDWRLFNNYWRYEPKRLIEDPKWDTSKQNSNGKSFGGRQEGQG